MPLIVFLQTLDEQITPVDKKRNKSDWNPQRGNNGKEQCQTYGIAKLNTLKKEQPPTREAKEDNRCDHKRTKKGYNHVTQSVGGRPPLKLLVAMRAGKDAYGLVVQFNLVRTDGALKQNHVPPTRREQDKASAGELVIKAV